MNTSSTDREEAERQKDLYRGISTDMSPEAIARRLRIASQLHRFGRKLYAAGRESRGEPAEDLNGYLLRVAEQPEQ